MSLALVALLSMSGWPAFAADFSTKALETLERHCYKCHGQNGSSEGDVDFILDPVRLIKEEKVVPGDAAKSRIYKNLTAAKDAKNLMPPAGDEPTGERPTVEEMAVIQAWINSGAAKPAISKDVERPFVSLADNLKAVAMHLESLDAQDRKYQRYFTLTNLHNLKTVKAQDLRLHRAALSKLINSLSWSAEITVPKPIDANQTVLNIDLRDFDWDQGDLWQQILQEYPYGLTNDQLPDKVETREAAKRIYELTKSRVPMMRADWFIATASRPPLYDALLQIPDTDSKLEEMLKVSFTANFRRNRLARIGLTQSNVSKAERMIERHPARYGSLWKSYDFKPGNDRSNLKSLPLGPAYEGSPFSRVAFKQDGGELIFHLPNGLQGYMLVNGAGKRIEKGPTDVVNDSKQTSGSPEIVNGLSCMACHTHGLIRKGVRDTVRDGSDLRGEFKDKVDHLYPPAEAIERLMDKDDRRFMTALQDAIGPILQVDEDKDRDIKSFAEPIGPIARWYRLQMLGLDEVAAEIGMPSSSKIKSAIEFNEELNLGLKPLIQGGKIKRELWESRGRGSSTFQKTANCLDLGVPVIFRK